VAAVDVADERRVNVVAEQFLQPFRQTADNITGNGQAVVLLRSEPAHGVLEDHAEPWSGGLIHTTAMPEAAQVEQG
jgi:hypothetical protein